MTPPSGEQIEIVRGSQRAVVVEVGGGLRSYAASGRGLLDGYGVDPTGTAPVEGRPYDFRRPKVIGRTTLDNAFTDLDRDVDGVARVELHHEEHGVVLDGRGVSLGDGLRGDPGSPTSGGGAWRSSR